MLRIARLCRSPLPALRLLALVLLGAVLLVAPAAAQDKEPAGEIAWAKDLTTAMTQAKEVKRPVMVCINAKFVEGRTSEEPAAKGVKK